jgi:predicted Zn-dependent peptidase
MLRDRQSQNPQTTKDVFLSDQIEHRRLSTGTEAAVLTIPGRKLAAIQVRVLGGGCYEDANHLGVAHVLSQAISKGTHKRDARGLNDAFDAIGCRHAAAAGRETVTFSAACLNTMIADAVELLAEMILTPSFPEDACEMACELTRQSLAALDDDPHELSQKHLHAAAYGAPLDRHVYGTAETLERIDRATIRSHWQQTFSPARMQIAVGGDVDAQMVFDLLEGELVKHETLVRDAGLKDSGPAEPFPLTFKSGRQHVHKDQEQQYIAMCFPGASATDEDEAAERVLLAVLSGGMSSRLWTEVREKQGLVYWVGAWADRPRQGGMTHLGASTTPDNVEATYNSLLNELDRLEQDIDGEELERAKVGMLASVRTHGDLTRARALRAANDLFYFGRPIALSEKLERIQKIQPSDIRSYLDRHPRKDLAVVTLGPQALK